jgi:hypothetical protein
MSMKGVYVGRSSSEQFKALSFSGKWLGRATNYVITASAWILHVKQTEPIQCSLSILHQG